MLAATSKRWKHSVTFTSSYLQEVVSQDIRDCSTAVDLVTNFSIACAFNLLNLDEADGAPAHAQLWWGFFRWVLIDKSMRGL